MNIPLRIVVLKEVTDAVLQVSASANPDLFEKLKGDESMCEALKKLMADEINEAVDKAEKDGE